MSNLTPPASGMNTPRSPRTRGVSSMVRGVCSLTLRSLTAFFILKHFKSATTGVATKTMRNELNRLVQTVSDPDTKRVRPPASTFVRFSTIAYNDQRCSTRRCSPSSTSLRVISLRRPNAKSCTQSLPTQGGCGYADTCASDWDHIKSPAADQIVPYDQLPKVTSPDALNKLAVLKVNGGLGTSMGMSRYVLLQSVYTIYL
jgi:UTP--glucose-1-phosphate uridylyltransferase